LKPAAYCLTVRALARAAAHAAACLALALALLLGACARAPRAVPTQSFCFVQLCDPQLGFGGYAHDLRTFEQAVAQINALAPPPDFVIICGDLVDADRESVWADFMRIKAGLNMPCHCVPGNHDVGLAPAPQTLAAYRRRLGPDYFAFEHKGCTFAMVNTQLWKAPLAGETEKQMAWLEETLAGASNAGQPIFIAGHYALYLNYRDEAEAYENLPRRARAEWLDLLRRRRVVAMIGGHTHGLIRHVRGHTQLVNGESTSMNLDGRPLGFRVWRVDRGGTARHEFVPLASPAANGE
jgi:predicted phosphodiesterase